MVGVHDILEDEGVLEPRPERRGDAEVVDAPPNVFGPGIEPVRPPGIVVGLLVELTEGIDEAAFNVPVKAMPLFDGEPGVVLVGLGVFKVDLLVCHVQVATENHGLFVLQFLYERMEISVPFLAVIEA